MQNADDTNLFVNGKSPNEVVAKTNQIIDRLKKYLEANYLHINVSKSKYLHFKPPRKKTQPPEAQILFNGRPLESVEDIKFLGVIIDQTLLEETYTDCNEQSALQHWPTLQHE